MIYDFVIIEYQMCCHSECHTERSRSASEESFWAELGI